MNAAFSIDGISFIIRTTKDDDISLILPDHMSEEVHLSLASTNLLILALLAAMADIEEDD